MDIDGIIILDAKSGLPLFADLGGDMDELLVSGFIAAIRNFSSELALGGLSSFTTEEKVFFLAARSRIITAILAPKEIDFKNVYSLAYEIGSRFEESYQEIPKNPDIMEYHDFSSVTKELLQQRTIPFIIKVAEFVKKEFGGEVSVQPRGMLQVSVSEIRTFYFRQAA